MSHQRVSGFPKTGADLWCVYKSGKLWIWDPARPFKESPGPFRPGIPEESPKESRGVFRPRGPENVRNSVGRVSGVSKNVLRLQRLFRDCFGHFLDPGAGRPRETLWETLRGFRARRARETPLRGGRDRNSGLLLFIIKSTARDVPGKPPGNFCGSGVGSSGKSTLGIISSKTLFLKAFRSLKTCLD